MTFWLVGLCLYEAHSVQPSLWDTVYLLVNLPPQHFYAKYFIEELIIIRGSSHDILLISWFIKILSRIVFKRTSTSPTEQNRHCPMFTEWCFEAGRQRWPEWLYGGNLAPTSKALCGRRPHWPNLHNSNDVTIALTLKGCCSVLHRNSISLMIIWLCSWRPHICISSERPCLPQALSHNQFITGPRRNVEYASKLPKTWKCVHKLCRKRHDLLADNSYFIQTRQHDYIVGAELGSGRMGAD